MKAIAALVFAATMWAPPAGAADASACAKDPDAAGLQSRMDAMHGQIVRIQSIIDDGAQQRRLIELHAKHMHEGLRELRRREARLEPRCHAELLQSLLEQMIVHQETVHALRER